MAEVNGTEESKRPRKLNKNITDDGVVEIEAIGGSLGKRNFDYNNLPEEIKVKLGHSGLSHKLGDSAAGKDGAEAEESITKVWEGLMAGDWSVRAPATPKVSVKSMVDKLENLDPESRAKAEELLRQLGVSI